MSITMYQASVPAFQKHLHALDGILDKAAAYAGAKKVEPAVLLGTRLFPDMFDAKRQIQVACDFAKSATARLAGVEPPSHPDTEQTIPELKARIAKTLVFIETVSPEKMDGSDDRSLTINVGPNEMTFTGRDYLLHFALPNFYFHCATAYGILRSCGLDVGKRDFMRRT
jgi:uncharacterized protein